MIRYRLVRAALAVALVLPMAAEAAIEEIVKSETWSAHRLTEKNSLICFVYGEPAKSTGDYNKRGKVFVQITHRPHANTVNEVGFTAGYDYKNDSDAVVEIDGEAYTLFTHNDGAWARDGKADTALVEAMKKGREMIIRGTSSRGTATVDSYSLIGFTRAHQAIDKACKIK